MKPSAVIFDLDGTLIDSERLNMKIWLECCRHFGFDMSEEFYRTLIGLSKTASNLRIQEHFGPGCPVQSIREHRAERFYAAWDNGCAPGWKPGLAELLEELEGRDLPRAVATSSSRPEAQAKLTRSRLLERFPVVVCGDEVGRGKPAPDVFLEAARRLGVDPTGCLAVEDSPLGVQAARAAGMRAAFVPDLIPPDPQLSAQARVFETLGDLLETLREDLP